MSKLRADDIDLLLPCMRPVIRALIARMAELGYEAIPFDTLRTPEEALRNAAKGTGIVRSMHLYGAACDLVCADHLWSCKAKGCKFFTKLGAAAKELGLVWGGDFPSKPDQPHVQTVEVREQAAMRALGTGVDKEPQRDALAAASIARRLHQ